LGDLVLTSLPYLLLLGGVPAVAMIPRPEVAVFWLCVYGAAAFALIRAPRSQGSVADSALDEAERRVTAGDAEGALALLSRLRQSLSGADALRVERLRSACCFLQGDLEAARAIARRLLGGPVDLEEGRQFRAWAAYLELAAGCPEAAFDLAQAAFGPPALAGPAWIAHCGTLQAEALEQQGEHEAALGLARVIGEHSSGLEPYASTLRGLRLRVAARQAWALGAAESDAVPAPRNDVVT
jgi:hypothetical protein